MKVLFRRLSAPLCIFLILAPASAFATNGYFLIGYGAKSRGMGGTGVAYASDALAAAANPATMTDVKMDTMRIDVGGEFFIPRRAASHNSALLPADEVSGSNLFLIPNMGGIYKFNRRMTIGMAAIGAGLGTRYQQVVPGTTGCINGDSSGVPAGVNNSYFFNFACNADSTTVGVSLMQMQMLPSAAYKINKQHSVGASLAIGVQQFRAYGLGAFESLGFAGSNSNVSGEGNDWAYGAGIRLGWLGKFFNQRLSLGVNYASRVYMTRFNKYKNLFAEQGSFDIPEHYAVGLAFKVTKALTVAADVQRIRYSSVRSVGNPGPTLDPSFFNPDQGCKDALLATGNEPKECKLGGDKGLGFGWQDQMVYKLGINYQYNSKWAFRAGYNYGKSPINESSQLLFNLLAPATVEHHMTLGASYAPNKNMEWSANFMHAFKNTLKGPTRFPPAGATAPVDNAAISMYQYSFGISFAYKM